MRVARTRASRGDALCRDGVDLYFDNVGGEMLDEALLHLAMHARVVLCGAISQYNDPAVAYGIKNYLSLIINRGTARGVHRPRLPRSRGRGSAVPQQVD